MKKFFLLLLLACHVLLVAAANDLIVTRNSERVDAIITEVSATEVRYRKVSNPNGPIFVMSMGEISSIIFANGEVMAVSAPAASSPDAAPQAPNASNVLTVAQTGEIVRRGKSFVLQQTEMDEAAYVRFVKKNCPDAYEEYLRHYKVELAGWGLFGGGLALTVTGLATWLTSPLAFKYDAIDNYAIEDNQQKAGFALFVVGAATTLGSIPVIVVGRNRKMQSYKVYNTSRQNTFGAASLHLQSSSNGLGLAMRF